MRVFIPCDADFNPLPPCGGRLSKASLSSYSDFDFNPLPPCGGRRLADHDMIYR